MRILLLVAALGAAVAGAAALPQHEAASASTLRPGMGVGESTPAPSRLAGEGRQVARCGGSSPAVRVKALLTLGTPPRESLKAASTGESLETAFIERKSIPGMEAGLSMVSQASNTVSGMRTTAQREGAPAARP